MSREKGKKDCVTTLPDGLVEQIKTQVQMVRAKHDKDFAEGEKKTSLPSGLTSKYPFDITDFKRQCLFRQRYDANTL